MHLAQLRSMSMNALNHLVQSVPYRGKSKWCEGWNRCAGDASIGYSITTDEEPRMFTEMSAH